MSNTFTQIGLIVRRVDNGYVVAYYGEHEWQKKEKIFHSVDEVFRFLREELAKAHRQILLSPPAPTEDTDQAVDIPF